MPRCLTSLLRLSTKDINSQTFIFSGSWTKIKIPGNKFLISEYCINLITNTTLFRKQPTSIYFIYSSNNFTLHSYSKLYRIYHINIGSAKKDALS